MGSFIRPSVKHKKSQPLFSPSCCAEKRLLKCLTSEWINNICVPPAAGKACLYRMEDFKWGFLQWSLLHVQKTRWLNWRKTHGFNSKNKNYHLQTSDFTAAGCDSAWMHDARYRIQLLAASVGRWTRANRRESTHRPCDLQTGSEVHDFSEAATFLLRHDQLKRSSLPMHWFMTQYLRNQWPSHHPWLYLYV